jgi:hypothetical protein
MARLISASHALDTFDAVMRFRDVTREELQKLLVEAFMSQLAAAVKTYRALEPSGTADDFLAFAHFQFEKFAKDAPPGPEN